MFGLIREAVAGLRAISPKASFRRAIIVLADASVQQAAADCLRLISAGNICYAWGMVLVQAFNGSGDTGTPSMINFFCYWCFQIPLAWTLAITLHWAPRGVYTAIPAAENAMTLASLALFRRGAWKKVMI